MASTRLTNAIRDEMIHAALAHRFKKDEAAYQKARTALADALYKHEFGAAERTAKRLPPGWVSESNYIEIVHDDYNRYRNGRSPTLKMSRPRLIPNNYALRTIQVGKDHPFYEPLVKLAAQETALADAKDELRSKLRSLVYTFNTTNKLFEAWPEGKRFLPRGEGAPTTAALVPVALAGEVNVLLGIAPKE